MRPVFLVVFTAMALLGAVSPAVLAGSLVIGDVRIVDVRSGKAGAPADVEITANRISRIAKTGTLRPDGTQRIEGRGAYLVPGFWDMHAHANSPEAARQWILPNMLAAGVTGLRDLKGDCWAPGCADGIRFMRELQADVAEGRVAGPRIMSIGSGLVHGPQERDEGAPQWTAPGNAAQALQLVAELKRRGVDFIKPYDTLPREAYFAMLREAKRLTLPVGGHVPLSVSTQEALQAGQVMIDHAKHPLLDCSSHSGEFHRRYAAYAEGGLGAPRVSGGAHYAPLLAGYDDAACADLLKRMARSGVYYVPTLITRKFEAMADDPAYLADERLSSVPPALLQGWQEDAGGYQKRFGEDPALRKAYMRFYEKGVELVGRADAAGVRMLVGTDVTDSYSFPGTGFHDEMREMSAGGMSNASILRAATLNAAQALGREADFGSVERGKIADLVLLDADPLVDIGNARRIRAVIFDGRVFDASALRKLEAESQAFVDSSPVPTADLFEKFKGTDRPGCAVSVIRDGRLIDSAAYGMSDIAAGVPLEADSVFNIASVSKQFTAFAILLLEQRGLLSRDDPITKYVPELGAYADAVTLRQLLHHTGGLRDYYGLLLMDGRVLTEPTTREQALELLTRQRGANAPPNSEYDYSNTGYFLLGLTVERVSGRSLRDFMAQNVFRPLGMTSTEIVDHYPAGIAKLARGYKPSEEGMAGAGFVIDESPWEQTGDGQVHTSVVDMARWESNLLSGAVGGKALVAAMEEPGVLASGKKLSYGAGVAVRDYRGLRTVRHGGDWAGYRAHFLRFPEQRFATVLFCNRADVEASEYTMAIADRYLAARLGPRAEEVSDAPPEPARNEPGWRPARPKDYAGRYRSAEAPGGPYEIRAGEGGLELHVAGKVLPLRAVAPHEFAGEGLPDGGDEFTLRVAAGRRAGFTLYAPGLRGLRFDRKP
jgi:CubicO group peptidase (beta-lactamase class C family)